MFTVLGSGCRLLITTAPQSWRRVTSPAAECTNIPSVCIRGLCSVAQELFEFTPFPVNPGSHLRVHLPLTASDIEVVSGDIDSITIQCSTPKQQDLQVKFNDNAVDVEEATNSTQGFIKCLVPARWCSLTLHTAGGGIKVQQVAEASFHAATNGGNLEFGSLAAGLDTTINTLAPEAPPTAVIATNTQGARVGGLVTGSMLRAENATIHCEGLKMQKLTCLKAQVHAGRGGVDVGAIYGESCALHTNGGGRITVGSASCHQALHVDSHGADIHLGPLDGTVSVESSGGSVQVQAADNLTSLQITSQGGNVTCSLSPSLNAHMRVTAERGVTAALGEDNDGATGAKVFDAVVKGSKPGPQTCSVGIDAGAGSAQLEKLSWISFMQQKLKQKG